MSPEWITVGAVVAGLVGNIFLAGDRFVHAQGPARADLENRIAQLRRDLDALIARFDTYHERHGRAAESIASHLTDIQVKIAKLEAFHESRK